MKFSVNAATKIGAVAAVLSVITAIYFNLNPGGIKIDASPELEKQISGLTAALRETALVVTDDDAENLRKRLSELEAEVAKRIASGKNEALPFVARSFVGLRRYPPKTSISFTAPNGVERLLVLDGASSGSTVSFQVGGEAQETKPRLGQHVDIEFGDQVCRFEVIKIVRREYFDLRVNCA